MLTRAEKRRRLDAAVANLLASCLFPLVCTKCIGTKELGRLAQASRAVNNAATNDELIWINIYKRYLSRYGIPQQVVERVGYRGLVRLMRGKFAMSKPPPLAHLVPPALTENDIILMGRFVYGGGAHRRVTKKFSITGEKLRPLLTGGGFDYDFGEPIEIADAEMWGNGHLEFADYGKRRIVGPAEIDWDKIYLGVRLIRLTDKKSCCIYQPNRHMPEWASLPALRPLDRSLDPQEWGDEDVIKLDFERDRKGGYIRLWDGSAHSDQCIGTRGLPMQNTEQANSLKMRFPYLFSFFAGAYLDVTPDKKFVITGFNLEAMKACLHADFGDPAEPVGFYDEESPEHENNGVTVAHMLSELHCSD